MEGGGSQHGMDRVGMDGRVAIHKGRLGWALDGVCLFLSIIQCVVYVKRS
jgi:hypothetical protein